ncbi:SGNH/GDSL hydrolase family protein [Nocardioides mangrovi]|uniref:SGNH/GDSL hydrolase family protein n=1 Tax=Nocardioides mangrovi TaxID=2874580 RepID=A0ABS7U9P0_9ACTN|nr:SGNH/GDSL hydrolase family protein [Nocardioides mangrovi]MBZ5737704.1 SGNH/GDSL hydrolase family protein [Nocardioides mangrovi]
MLGGVLAFVLASLVIVHVADRARADDDRCQQFASDSRIRATEDTGTGERVVVIGDSWSAGLGLDRSVGSWPSRLAGSVHVAGFSGSGFSEHASPCGRVSFADRAASAIGGGADLVVVEGGLNDFDQTAADVRAGFVRLMSVLHGQHVVIVGPAMAPSRAARVPAVDDLLARLCEQYDVTYVRTSGLDLPYLGDRLHLTAAGHEEFGDYVRDELAAL